MIAASAKIELQPSYATQRVKCVIVDLLTHKIDWSRRHRKNDRNNVLFANAEIIHRDPNIVDHSTRTVDDRDAIYYRDHLSDDVGPIALLCMHVAQTRISLNVPCKCHNRKAHALFVNDL